MKQLIRRLFGKDQLWEMHKRLERIELQNRVTQALARAQVTRAAQTLDPHDPETWEFSGFSQHGEDGIVDYLVSRLLDRNEYFVEIGAADGTQNGTAWLAFVRLYGGLMIEGDPAQSKRAEEALQALNWGVRYVSAFVDQDNVAKLLKQCPYRDPDVFSLDIDGIDFYVAKAIFASGMRPKIFIVEYNSAFGPEKPITVPYQKEFSRFHVHPSGLYYGVSIAAWRSFFSKLGYEFITTDRSGTNAFFIDPAAFPAGFPGKIRRVDFRMNYSDQNGATRPTADPSGDLVVRRLDWKTQMQMIQDLPVVETTAM